MEQFMNLDHAFDLDGLVWDSPPPFQHSPSTANVTTPQPEVPTTPLTIENGELDPKKLQVCSSCRR